MRKVVFGICAMVLCAGIWSVPCSSMAADKSGYARKAGEVTARVYMTSWCPYCKKTSKFLKELGVKFTEYDIEKDEKNKDEMKRLSGGGTMVPLIDVEGIVIRGYDPDEIRDAVNERRKVSSGR